MSQNVERDCMCVLMHVCRESGEEEEEEEAGVGV